MSKQLERSAFDDFLASLPQDRFAPARVIARGNSAEEALGYVAIDAGLGATLAGHLKGLGGPSWFLPASIVDGCWQRDDSAADRLGLARLDDGSFAILVCFGDFADSNEGAADYFTARLAQELGGEWCVIACSSRPWTEVFLEKQAEDWGPRPSEMSR